MTDDVPTIDLVVRIPAGRWEDVAAIEQQLAEYVREFWGDDLTVTRRA